MKKKIWKQCCEEPFRILFPFGMIMGVVGVEHWLFYAVGWTGHYSMMLHAAMQSQVYLMAFVIGFLVTAIPRFSGSKSCSARELLSFFSIFLLMSAAILTGCWMTSRFLFLGLLFLLFRFILVRIGKRKSQKNSGALPPTEFVWIPWALVHGLIGTLFMILRPWGLPLWSLKVGKVLTEQGIILCIVIGIGGFLGPRLMGTFRPPVRPNEKGIISDEGKSQLKKRIIWHLIAGGVFFLSFFCEISPTFSRFGYFLRAFVITAEYAWTCTFLRWPRVPDFYAWLVWVSLGMVVLGSWAVPILFSWRTAMLHLVFIGGFSLMIFSVATMVTLTHGGEVELLRKPLGILKWIALTTSVALLYRVGAVFHPEKYFYFLGFAAAIWGLGALAWLVFMRKRFFKLYEPEVTQRFHEDAKKRILKLQGNSSCTDSSSSCDSKK